MVKGTRRRISLHMIWIALLLAVQLLCSLFFILDIFSSVLGLRAVPCVSAREQAGAPNQPEERGCVHNVFPPQRV